MRLLIVSQTVAPWTPHYARYFAARGDSVLVASMSPHPLPGVPVEFIGIEPWDKFKNKHLFLTRLPRLRRLIRDFRPDLLFAPYIISNGLTAVLAWKGPTVVSGRGGDVLEQTGRRGLKPWLRARVIRYVCRKADLVHVVAPGLYQELIRLGVAVSKLIEFPLGVDTRLFRPSNDEPRPDPREIICTRKHEPIYSNATIIQSLAALRSTGRDFHCTFIGGGHLLDDCRQNAARMNVQEYCTFAGDQPHERLPDLLRRADVFVSASLSDGTSSALLEAMSCGLLPVVSDIPANRPWIRHGVNGLLFEPRNAASLAQGLEIALTDGDLRRRASRINPARIEQDGSADRNMRRLAEVFQKVLDGVQPGRDPG